jgi:poly-gamma-glutamate system protein
MKKLYWRPSRVSRLEVSFIAMLAVAGMIAVETFPEVSRRRHYREKLAAAQLAERALHELKKERQRRHIPINHDADPAQTGLIGDLLSPIASNTGHLPAKQTAINPNFAAVVAHQLRTAEVERGDVVAVGMSGSFPGLNVAVYAALESLGTRPIVIASASASQWGATNPRFTWLDMERALQKARIFSNRSVAASLGGIDDRALGLSGAGKRLLVKAIERADLPLIEVESYEESVEKRMGVYRQHAAGRPVKAYVNVGGGTASVGTRVGKRMFRPGLNRSTPVGDIPDSVMLRFSQAGVPVVHLSHVSKLANRYGLPLAPTVMPRPGQGRVFVTVGYNLWLAAGTLLAILVTSILFLRMHIGLRVSSAVTGPRKRSGPSEMI